MHKFTVLKSDSIEKFLPAFLKIIGTLMESIFRIVMGVVDWKARIIYKELD